MHLLPREGEALQERENIVRARFGGQAPQADNHRVARAHMGSVVAGIGVTCRRKRLQVYGLSVWCEKMGHAGSLGMFQRAHLGNLRPKRGVRIARTFRR